MKGFRLLAVGIVIGLFASYELTRFLASQIWGVSPTDPWTFAVVAVIVVAVGLRRAYCRRVGQRKWIRCSLCTTSNSISTK